MSRTLHLLHGRRRLLLGALLPVIVLLASRDSAPIVPVPASARVDPAQVALGERLFHDVRLSGPRTYSCASCHPLERGGMDGRPVAQRIDGTPHTRNTPTVFNVGLNASFNWDGSQPSLEAHARATLPGLLDTSWEEVVARLEADDGYRSAFAAAFRDGVTPANVTRALAAFQRSLLTPNAPFDRYLAGDGKAITERQKEGYELFRRYGCAACHQGVNAGGNMFQRFGVFEDVEADRPGPIDPGRLLVTGEPRDARVFRVPGLRNVAITAPYFHDGHAATLEEAVSTMGRAQLGRRLPREELALLVEFLQTLTGEYRGRSLAAARNDPG